MTNGYEDYIYYNISTDVQSRSTEHSRVVLVLNKKTKWNGLKSIGMCFQNFHCGNHACATFSDRFTFRSLAERTGNMKCWFFYHERNMRPIKKTVTSHTTDYEYFMHLTFIFGICNRKKINMEQLLGLPQLCGNVYCSVRANCFASGCKHLFVASQQKAKHPCMNIVV